MKVAVARNCEKELSPSLTKDGLVNPVLKEANLKAGIGAPFLSIWRIQITLVMTSAHMLLGHFIRKGF